MGFGQRNYLASFRVVDVSANGNARDVDGRLRKIFVMMRLPTEVQSEELLARLRGHCKIPALMFVGFISLYVPSARGHNGPPFPMIVDQRVGRIRMLAWGHFLSWWMRYRATRFPMI
jgi:hypothetical protein